MWFEKLFYWFFSSSPGSPFWIVWMVAFPVLIATFVYKAFEAVGRNKSLLVPVILLALSGLTWVVITLGKVNWEAWAATR